MATRKRAAKKVAASAELHIIAVAGGAGAMPVTTGDFLVDLLAAYRYLGGVSWLVGLGESDPRAILTALMKLLPAEVVREAAEAVGRRDVVPLGLRMVVGEREGEE